MVHLAAVHDDFSPPGLLLSGIKEVWLPRSANTQVQAGSILKRLWRALYLYTTFWFLLLADFVIAHKRILAGMLHPSGKRTCSHGRARRQNENRNHRGDSKQLEWLAMFQWRFCTPLGICCSLAHHLNHPYLNEMSAALTLTVPNSNKSSSTRSSADFRSKVHYAPVHCTLHQHEQHSLQYPAELKRPVW